MLSGNSKAALQKAKIKPGSIVHFYCHYISNPKNKFLVVVHVDPKEDLVLGFFINSEIHPFLKSNPDLLICQFQMKKAKYGFLINDSFLDCSDLQDQIGLEELAAHLTEVEDDYKGEVAEEDLVEIIQLVNSAKTISEYDKDLIMNSFG